MRLRYIETEKQVRFIIYIPNNILCALTYNIKHNLNTPNP